MAFRRGRRSRRSAGSRRRGHWEGFFAAVDGTAGWTAHDVFTFWAKWPSGVVDDSASRFTIDVVAPEDETWTKVWVRPQLLVESSGLGGGIEHFRAAFGLIQWEAEDPDNLEDTVFHVGERAPDPLDVSMDWIWRYEWAGCVAEGLFFTSTPLNTLESHSRAMRKLSSRAGVLACFGATEPDGFDVQNVIRFDCAGRMYVKNAK